MVQFRSDGLGFGGPVALVDGIARLTNSSLPQGSYLITAEYAGDDNCFGSTNQLGVALVINTAPTTGADSVTRFATSGVKLRLTSLLANDADADGDPLVLATFMPTSVKGGTVSSNSGWLIYSPPAGFTNADGFFYGITDPGHLSATGLVSITVTMDASATPNVGASQMLPSGSRQVRMLGIPGRRYTIQSAADSEFLVWQTLTNLIAGSRGELDFTDSASATASPPIYRATIP